MKLSIMGVQPSTLRHLAESVPYAPSPAPGQRSLTYHLLFSALDLGVLREGMLSDLLAKARASSQPIPNLDHLLWITAPQIDASTAQLTDLARRAGHLPGSILDGSTESRAWWQEAYALFGADANDQARVQQQTKAWSQAMARDEWGEEPGDEEQDAVPASRQGAGKPAGGGAGLSDEMRKQLAAVVKRHKDTGDKIDALINDLRKDLARRDPKGAFQHAQEIIQRDKAEQAQQPAGARRERKQKDDGPVTKHTVAPKPRSQWAEPGYAEEGADDYLFAAVLAEESMVQRGEEVLAHAMSLLHAGGGRVVVTPLGRELYENWRDRLRSLGQTRIGSRLRSGASGLLQKGKDAWAANADQARANQDKFHASLKGLAGRAMDRIQDPVGTHARDQMASQRVQNVLMAKNAIALLTQLATDKLERLPMGRGQELLKAEKTPENRRAARVALGMEQEAKPAQPQPQHDPSQPFSFST